MPEFFFHITLELHDYAQRSRRSVDQVWPSGSQTLAPFLSGKGPKAPHSKRTIDNLAACRVRRREVPTSRANNGGLGAHEEFLPDDFGTNCSPNSTTHPEDKRLDRIYIESTDGLRHSLRSNKMDRDNHISKGIGTSANGVQTRGRYEPLDQRTTDSVWGIVHLYRDTDETPGLYGDALLSKPSNPWYSRATKENKGEFHPPAADHECTTLCILAVPSYLAPSDFLGFVGEETREQVSHFRMIRTARANRYMVLIKFRDGKMARKWQMEWNGKVFNSMEPETCHVVFIKSVEIITTSSSPDTFPDTKNDPFTSPHAHSSSAFSSTKPLAPRTPSLIELPTCPVCLERMDETTGLLTIVCQHVFHCPCLQKWSGGGCPVCRYTHDDFSSRPRFSGKSGKSGMTDSYGDYHRDAPIDCETCHLEANLWQCLICGNIGCGRYEAKHAFSHYEETGHSFAMDMESKRVWDYAGDGYVHRIIQTSADGLGGKLVELPGPTHHVTALDPSEGEDDRITREKIEGLSLEYTHLLTSQLESQRVYFEEQVERAADKAAKASAEASAALSTAKASSSELTELKQKYDDLARAAVPALEREKARVEKRADRFEAMARTMEKEYREEKAMNARLMERIQHLGKEIEELKATKTDLEEQNRDLTFYITSSEKLRGSGEEVQEGTLSIPDPPTTGRKMGKGKGRR